MTEPAARDDSAAAVDPADSLDPVDAAATSPRVGLFVAVTAGAAAIDLVTKAWAVDALIDLPGRAVMVVDPWLELALTWNQGTAFSMIRDLGAARWFFGAFSLGVAAALWWMVRRGGGLAVEAVALGLLASGALGNGYDRVFRIAPNGGTGVVDFVKVNYPWGGSWPTFNVADGALVVGAGLLLWMALRGRWSPPGSRASG